MGSEEGLLETSDQKEVMAEILQYVLYVPLTRHQSQVFC